jgi:ketosteroid isomerase-like protein
VPGPVEQGIAGSLVPVDAGRMAFDFEALLDLWVTPLPHSEAEAADRIRTMYTDPVTVNGVPLSAHDLAARARMVQGTFDERDTEVLDVVEAGDKVAVAFRMGGLHVGPFATALGVLPGTGERLDIRVIDILTLTDGKISDIWMCADELGALVAVDAVRWS